jgi:ribonuclease HI
MSNKNIEIYTDGSCHTQLKLGVWTAIIFVANRKIVLEGMESITTHNRMELSAVINALDYLDKENLWSEEVHVYSDSQYVVGLLDRAEKLILADFVTQKRKQLNNVDLIKELFRYTKNGQVRFFKIKAHQKKTDVPNYNIEVDQQCRKILRAAVLKLT